MDEGRLLRDRVEALQKRIDARGNHQPHRIRTMIGHVFSEGSFPTAAGRFFAVRPVVLDGAEVENGTGQLSQPNAQAVEHVYWTRTALPAIDDVVEAFLIRDRWVSEPVGTPPCDHALTINVKACGCNWAGVSITVTQPGGFSFTGTTDSSGNLDIPGIALGLFSYDVTPPHSYTTHATGTVTLGCTHLVINTGFGASGISGDFPCSTGFPTNQTIYACSDLCKQPLKTHLTLSCDLGSTGLLAGTDGDTFNCHFAFPANPAWSANLAVTPPNCYSAGLGGDVVIFSLGAQALGPDPCNPTSIVFTLAVAYSTRQVGCDWCSEPRPQLPAPQYIGGVATQAWNCHVGEPFDFTFNFPGDFVPDAHTVALGCDLTGAPSIGTITITP